MGRRRRFFEKERIYFITTKTVQDRFLLKPSPLVNEVIGGILARAVQMYDVELFGYIVMSNHVHLLARAEGKKLSEFVQYVFGNIARKVGLVRGWKSAVWQHRCSMIAVLDDEALEERLQYMLSHGVKESLVEAPEQWPGLHMAKEVLQGPREYRYYTFAELDEALFAAEREPKGPVLKYLLKLTPLPHWAMRALAKMREILDGIKEAALGKKVSGTQKIEEQSPFDAPAHVEKRPAPLCHAKDAGLRATFKAAWKMFNYIYSMASEAYRKGQEAVFPPLSYKPTVYVAPNECALVPICRNEVAELTL
jgi:REP element-mobilizing transposase RayT